MKLDGRVELIELVGTGAMGAVFKATQQGIDRAVAVKALHQTALFDKEHVARFFREAKVVSTMNHPNIVKVYAVGLSENRQPYMVMDYIEGETLADLISQRKLSGADYLDVFSQVAAGLAHAHRREVVHRDIKPRNILIQRDAEKGKFVVKIVDFGIARNVVPDTVQRITQTGVIIGSPIYMSPEQCTGRQVDSRTDLYSLGCVMFEAATGSVPFYDKNAAALIGKHVMEPAPPLEGRTVIPDLSPDVAKVVALLLNKKPEHRYPDAETLLNDLTAIKEGSAPPFASNFSLAETKAPPVPAAQRTTNGSATTVIVGSMVAIAIFFGVRWVSAYQRHSVPTDAYSPAATNITKLCMQASSNMEKHCYNDALNSYRAAYDICTVQHIEGKMLADVCNARAFCEWHTGNLQNADKYYGIAYDYYKDSDNGRILADIGQNYGKVLLTEHQPDKAAALLTVSYGWLKKGETESQCSAKVLVLRELCAAYVEAGKPYSAIALFPSLIQLEQTYLPEECAATHTAYANALTSVGRKAEAEQEMKLAQNYVKAQKKLEDSIVGN